MRTLRPASYTGLDLNPAGVAFCRERHNLPGLDFVEGDAENLPFVDQSFDAVINVEASHCYPRFPRFLTEVARVLRPGGHFLYVDVRPRNRFAAWDAALAGAPLRMVSHTDVTREVLRGIEKNTHWSLNLVDRHQPAFLRPFGRKFAVAQGSQSIATCNAENCRSGCTGSPRIEPASGSRCSPCRALAWFCSSNIARRRCDSPLEPESSELPSAHGANSASSPLPLYTQRSAPHDRICQGWRSHQRGDVEDALYSADLRLANAATTATQGE